MTVEVKGTQWRLDAAVDSFFKHLAGDWLGNPGHVAIYACIDRLGTVGNNGNLSPLP